MTNMASRRPSKTLVFQRKSHAAPLQKKKRPLVTLELVPNRMNPTA
jgi:hypothetical protein